MTPGFIRSDFAGPGGLSEGLRLLGVAGEVGVELDESACAIARAAGHDRWQADVTSAAVRNYPWPPIWLYLATPECQTFSTAGKGGGRLHLASYIEALYLVAGGATPEAAVAQVNDAALKFSAILSLEPMLVIRQHMPLNIAFEQVPGVLPLWDAYARILRAWGYSVWTGVLTSEQYGVPQTRRRAILMASRERAVTAPAPTHSRYYSRDPERLDGGVLPWVSMAQALGYTATMRSNYGTGGDPANRGERTADQPAPTITTKAGRNKWQLGDARRANGTLRDADEPAPTISGSLDNGNTRRWEFNDQSGTPFDPSWPEKRPATAVAGREIVQNPGATANRFNGSTKSRNDGVRVTVEEAGVLQSFRPDYPWAAAATKTQRFRHVGNAVPPLLARAVLGSLLDIPFDPARPAYARALASSSVPA